MDHTYDVDRLKQLVFAAASMDALAVFVLADFVEEHGIDHPVARVAIRARQAGEVTHRQYQAFRVWNSELICGPGKLMLHDGGGRRRDPYVALLDRRGRLRRRGPRRM